MHDLLQSWLNAPGIPSDLSEIRRLLVLCQLWELFIHSPVLVILGPALWSFILCLCSLVVSQRSRTDLSADFWSSSCQQLPSSAVCSTNSSYPLLCFSSAHRPCTGCIPSPCTEVQTVLSGRKSETTLGFTSLAFFLLTVLPVDKYLKTVFPTYWPVS